MQRVKGNVLLELGFDPARALEQVFELRSVQILELQKVFDLHDWSVGLSGDANIPLLIRQKLLDQFA